MTTEHDDCFKREHDIAAAWARAEDEVKKMKEVYEKAIAFVQVWENSPILLNSETGGALADAVNRVRVRTSSERSKPNE